MRKLFGFIGLAIGAVCGLLFAPRKGKEFREQLKHEWSEDGTIKETVKEQIQGFASEAGKTVHEVSEMPEVQHAIERGKHKVCSCAEDIAEVGKEQAHTLGKKLGKMISNWQKKIKKVR